LNGVEAHQDLLNISLDNTAFGTLCICNIANTCYAQFVAKIIQLLQLPRMMDGNTLLEV
jgi:hypothetical protein